LACWQAPLAYAFILPARCDTSTIGNILFTFVHILETIEKSESFANSGCEKNQNGCEKEEKQDKMRNILPVPTPRNSPAAAIAAGTRWGTRKPRPFLDGVLSLLDLGLTCSETQLHLFFVPEELSVTITAISVVLPTMRGTKRATPAVANIFADSCSVDTVVTVTTMNHMVLLSFYLHYTPSTHGSATCVTIL
jgi:hypothetical protein